MSEENESEREDDTPHLGSRIRYILIGIDYGTTFTSISYFTYFDGEAVTTIYPSDIATISNWPEDPMRGLNLHVPTEQWYSSIPINRSPTTGRIEPDPEVDGFSSSSEEENENEPSRLRRSPAPRPDQRLSQILDSSSADDDSSPDLLWGFQCPYQRYIAHTTRDYRRHVDRVKLMLLNTEHTKKGREELQPVFEDLIENQLVRNNGIQRPDLDCELVQDMITDYLAKIFQHTRQELIARGEYDNKSCVKFALTVPVMFSKISSLVLQWALGEAIRVTGFGTLTNRNVDNLFLVTEPKAAATFLLGSSKDLTAGATFVVCDCGGGTVDASTFSVARSQPLRLGEEVCPPAGDNCGASYLNENFRRLMLEKLRDEAEHFERNGNTIESLVDAQMPNFEDHLKRNRDIYKNPSARIYIPGLRGDKRQGREGQDAKGFDDNYVWLYQNDFHQIFFPLLDRVARVIQGQLEAAIALGKEVKHVFLTGGFGASLSLQSHLQKFLAKFAEEVGLSYEIDLVLPRHDQDYITAVSSGAVLLTRNPEDGIPRLAETTYGFLTKQLYEPDWVGHTNGKPVLCPLEACLMIEVIDNFLEQGDILDSKHKWKPLTRTHHFPVDDKTLLCEEVLYVSDTTSSSEYHLNHEQNKNAQPAGNFFVDFTKLRNQGKIRPKGAGRGQKGKGKARYEITYDLILLVDGRNLKIEVRYPSGQYGKIVKVAQICIAASFKPGTS
ncbi:uncharacterized protein LY89DRAFT_596948 [Mollisia scopiformis]|uniref:Uncharacterized protein n=1 Tax=Mollisia scopiformis TaxID=149040 RepID=A0A132BCX7_MOLSC|nr:uncharacterized protein LY89DRAFT_596948 [Mollisia scopiformis]KUJ10103.1 hypothetical protein LY89DRAFT_596948 [Mollisia scopiformis]